MQVLFVLQFYHLNKTYKIDRLIHDSGSKMAVKISSQKPDVLRLFWVTAGNIHYVWLCSKETLWIMYPKYLALDMI